mmetsp:Transcript_53948/g.151606  ORF Transcript_53948/g.151606 Transcript_53948/m.151606 type:complete len:255 (-) Transcript_53948:74-838(-)
MGGGGGWRWRRPRPRRGRGPAGDGAFRRPPRRRGLRREGHGLEVLDADEAALRCPPRGRAAHQRLAGGGRLRAVQPRGGPGAPDPPGRLHRGRRRLAGQRRGARRGRPAGAAGASAPPLRHLRAAGPGHPRVGGRLLRAQHRLVRLRREPWRRGAGPRRPVRSAGRAPGGLHRRRQCRRLVTGWSSPSTASVPHREDRPNRHAPNAPARALSYLPGFPGQRCRQSRLAADASCARGAAVKCSPPPTGLARARRF